jgi:hypothetical protein
MDLLKLTLKLIGTTFLLSFVFCETTTPSEPESNTRIDGRTYTNRELDFAISAPREWDIYDTGEVFRNTANELLVVMRSPESSEGGFYPTTNVVYGAADRDDCSEYIAEAHNEFVSSDDFRGISEIADSLRNTTVDTSDSMKACRYTFTIDYIEEADTMGVWVEQRFWIREKRLIVVTMITPTEMYSATTREFAEIVESIDVFLDE